MPDLNNSFLFFYFIKTGIADELMLIKLPNWYNRTSSTVESQLFEFQLNQSVI